MKNRVINCWNVLLLISLLFNATKTESALIVSNDIAVVTIARPVLESVNSFEFSLNITRVTDEWRRWANGTFQISVLGGVNYDNLGFELIKDSTDLNLSIYTVTPRIITKTNLPGNRISAERLSITVLGPKPYGDAFLVPLDSTMPLRIGKFRIYTLDQTPFPTFVSIDWLQPVSYYQTTAYKLLNDSIPWHVGDNNIEMTSRLRFYTEPRFRYPGMQIFVCDSTYYEGQKVNRIQWRTSNERNSYGFTLWRALLPYGETNISTLQYSQIASFPGIGKGNSNGTFFYPSTPYYDSLDILRGERYFYKVISMSSDIEVNVDSAGVPIEGICSITVPYAVIVKAVPMDNPFSSSTLIKYKLDDDVYLTIKVYDVIGNLVETLMDNKFMRFGNHEITFQASEFAQQGLYNVIFIAKPIKDDAVELSRAILKLELIR